MSITISRLARPLFLIAVAVLVALAVSLAFHKQSAAAGEFCVPSSGYLNSLGYSSTHKALDILTSLGPNQESVYASRSGTIRWVFRDDSTQPFHGVVIEHQPGDGHVYRTIYLHMGLKNSSGTSYLRSDILAAANAAGGGNTRYVNIPVAKGDFLGKQGNAGIATAVHLHFQLQVDPNLATPATWGDADNHAVDPRNGYFDTAGPGATTFAQSCFGAAADTQLTNGAPLSGQSVAQGQWRYYSIIVPPGATNLTVQIYSGSGDPDLYTNFGSKPTSSTWACRPWTSGSTETCSHSNPSAGTWWIGVNGYSAGTYTVKATYTVGSTTTIPSAPSNPSAVATSSSSIRITWQDNSNNENGFEVNNCCVSQYAGANATSYTWGGLAPNTWTCFHVRAYNSAGSSAWTGYACATTLANTTIPNAPSNPTAVAISSSSIRITWQDNSNNETGFEVNNCCVSQYVGTNATSFTWGGLAPNTWTCFHVRAYNSAGSSAWTGYACTSTLASTVTCSSSQYTAQYYNNRYLTLGPALTQCEGWPISHDWGSGGPGSGVGSDNFSARWTGRAYIAGGTYTFIARADDGVRVWIDNNLIIDAWRDQAATEYRASRAVSSGDHDIKVEYYENGGAAVAQFRWEQATGIGRSTVIVDDQSSGFGHYGTYWWQQSIGYNGHMWWTWTNGGSVSSYAYWSASISGRYEVYAFIPNNYATTRNASYALNTSSGITWASVNQNNYYDQWVSIGTYDFTSGADVSGGYGWRVFLSDATGESAGAYRVGFDAVKFEPR